ncbi:hypothetical protein RB600_000900 [Gaeumannomyces tritici]
MCFGDKPARDPSAVAPRPAALPAQQQTFSSMPETKPGAPTKHCQPPTGPPWLASSSAAAMDPTNYHAPPPGPADYTAPPPGPPPAQQQQQQQQQPPPPQHNWQAVVPDTSLFPPPPDVFSSWERSPANNATEEEMEAGEAWCAQHPLCPPVDLNQDPDGRAALAAHNPRLMRPQGFNGDVAWAAPGVWRVRTAHERCSDTTVCAYPPLYCAREHSPRLFAYSSSGGKEVGRRARTVYYEVQVLPDSRPEEASLSIGFAALPYPPFRLPGWHRGSVAVHGDDGHRYTSDLGGGRSFAEPFRRGDRYGVGITFTALPDSERLGAEVFFTHNGALAGSWDLHEETDADQSSGLFGLEGHHDLSCAIGTFNRVSFEVIFDPARWMYQGVQQE